jgi:hypothetical protein
MKQIHGIGPWAEIGAHGQKKFRYTQSEVENSILRAFIDTSYKYHEQQGCLDGEE